MALLGSTLLQLGFLFCLLSLLLGASYLYKQDLRFYVGARRGIMVGSVLAIAAAVVLIHEIMVSNFSLEYVARYSSATTPTMYKFAGLWAGMEGSLLFWLTILGGYVFLLNYLNRNKNRSLMPVVNIVFGIVMLF
ncbi:MAG: hypothetical protein IID14_02505, partial [Candidatus Marinimicrobia bacterium]|nr:hypothetical protein [Candidatus Neomarinimicrobiota bacterium]